MNAPTLPSEEIARLGREAKDITTPTRRTAEETGRLRDEIYERDIRPGVEEPITAWSPTQM